MGLHKVLSMFAMPLGLVFGIGPQFAEVNDTLYNAFMLVYTQQTNLTIRGERYFSDSLPIMFGNMAVFFVLFLIVNALYNLDGERKKR